MAGASADTHGERWLVTGGCGLLGSHVLAELHAHRRHCIGTSRRPVCAIHGPTVQIDLRDVKGVLSLLRSYAPTHIVHLAAIASPGAAQRAPGEAWALNVGLTGRLAEYARTSGCHMLVASSDFVWSGESRRRYRETDRPSGHSVYAQTKIAAEAAVLARDAGVAVRYSLMYGSPKCPKETLFDRQLRQLVTHAPLTVVRDEYRTPVSLHDAARATIRICEARYRGIIHVAGPEVLTPVDQVRAYARALSLEEPELIYRRRSDLDPLVRRPRNMAMATTVLGREFRDILPGRVCEQVRGANVPAPEDLARITPV